MPRRPATFTTRRLAESGLGDSLNSGASPLKSQRSPLLSVCLVLLGIIILLCYSFTSSDSGRLGGGSSTSMLDESLGDFVEDEQEEFASRPECRTAICQVLPLLRKVYSDSMDRVLHVGPSACGVVRKLLKEEKTEAWGLLPFDPQPPVHSVCENLIGKGLIRVADVTHPLPYRSNSFSLVLANDIVNSMTTRQLNVTLRELARVTSESVVLFVNGKAIQKTHDATGDGIKPTKTLKPRSKLWWQHHLPQYGLQQNKEATEKFEALISRTKFKSSYYIFHLISSDARR